MDEIKTTYETLCKTPSDINEHLQTLCDYAKQCESVFETGVRGVVSSWALSYGLLLNGSTAKTIFFNDITECNIKNLTDLLETVNINWGCEWKNNLYLNFEDNVTFDMTFIDTWHVYAQLKRELEKFAKITNKYIIMHDTTVDEIHGETIRMGWNAKQQSLSSGFPEEEIKKGLWPAVEEFLNTHNDWTLEKRYTNNNGLTILKRIK